MSTLQQKTVLVVDDQDFMRKSLSLLIQKCNYTVLTAKDGLDALAVMKSHPEIALIWSDVSMPEMDGVAMGRVIRKSQPAMPIVYNSGDLGHSGYTLADVMAISPHYLKKGGDFKTIQAMVKSVLGD